MRILLIGSGGREHALAWKLSESSQCETIFTSENNAGMQSLQKCISLEQSVFSSWRTCAHWAKNNGVDLLVVGPEQPLAEGVVDEFETVGIPCFGPSQRGALLESSKIFCKDFLNEANIPTAKSVTCVSHEEALKYSKEMGLPCVFKADGLAAGKGVFICNTQEEVHSALSQLFIEKKFGAAGSRVLIEEYLTGPEISYMVFTNGSQFVPLEIAQDHKRLLDHDKGPNTGGMGAYSPTSLVNSELQKQIHAQVIGPTLRHLQTMRIPFVGTLYAGLMLTPNGPKVLEYNVRLGDPETQVLMRRLDHDLADILLKCATKKEIPNILTWSNEAACGVVLAAKGYPDEPLKNQIILGLDQIQAPVHVFHSAVKNQNDSMLTTGGRVLTVTSRAPSMQEAKDLCYQAIKKISFNGMQYRTDIGYQST